MKEIKNSGYRFVNDWAIDYTSKLPFGSVSFAPSFPMCKYLADGLLKLSPEIKINSKTNEIFIKKYITSSFEI